MYVATIQNLRQIKIDKYNLQVMCLTPVTLKQGQGH